MFDTVYVEEDAFEYETTRRILGKLTEHSPAGKVSAVTVKRAADVLARRCQDYGLQRSNPKLILAVNRGPFIFEGSRNCQDFGSDVFRYCSVAVNCIARCRYCYLSGASRSANLTVFVNKEDCFRELSEFIGGKRACGGNTPRCEDVNNGKSQEASGRLLIPVSYDNDVYAMEGLLGYVKDFAGLAVRLRREGLDGFDFEVRTKCGTKSFLDGIDNAAAENMVFTWSVAPVNDIRLFEPATSPLKNRLDAAEYALKKGFRVRLAFDPVLAVLPGWREDYASLVDEIRSRGIVPALDGAGVGGFRVPADYLKVMRKNDPAAAPLFDLYHESRGTLCYSREREQAVTEHVRSCLTGAGLDASKIYSPAV